MTDQGWGGGYTESSYVRNGYSELAPTNLDWAVGTSGIASPRTETGFHYLELGCGFATSVIANAAVHPEGQFYGVDFNPQHIVAGRALARKAGLSNVMLFDDSFAEFLSRDLPEFEYIVLHGVYSWVDAQVRSQLREIIRKKVKPGGLILISYNCMAGTAQYAPLRDMLRLEVARRQGSFEQRVRDSVATLRQWQQSDLPFFVQNPRAAKRLGTLLDHGTSYVAHEFLNASWTAFSHAEIVEEMSALKLSFVASAGLARNFDASLPVQWQKQVAEIGDPVLRETMRDLVTLETFRSDIFVRGPVALPVVRRRQEQLDGRFMVMLMRRDWFKELNVFGRKVIADPTVAAPVLEALEAGPASFREICRTPSLADVDSANVWERIVGLVLTGHLLPAMPADRTAACRESADRLNHAILEDTRERLMPELAMVSPVTGTFVGIGIFELLFLLAERTDRASVAPQVLQWATQYGGKLVLGGVTYDQAGGLTELGQRYEIFRQNARPFLEQLGLATPP